MILVIKDLFARGSTDKKDINHLIKDVLPNSDLKKLKKVTARRMLKDFAMGYTLNIINEEMSGLVFDSNVTTVEIDDGYIPINYDTAYIEKQNKILSEIISSVVDEYDKVFNGIDEIRVLMYSIFKVLYPTFSEEKLLSDIESIIMNVRILKY